MYVLIDKDLVLEKLNPHAQQKIFEHYLGIPVQCETNFVCPPILRVDHRATANFFINGEILMFKDFNGISGDCFQIVQHIFNLHSYNAAIRKVAKDFDLFNIAEPASLPQLQLFKGPVEVKQKPPAEIVVYGGKWLDYEKIYWLKYGITKTILDEYEVQPVKNLWVNGSLIYQRDINPELCFDYRFSPLKRKIYFPNRKTFRFIGNTNALQGWKQLPETDEALIITKALKDVMVFRTIGFSAVAPQTEACINPATLDKLKARFPLIFSNYDLDSKGIAGARALQAYGIQPIMLKDSNAKDISDYRYFYGLDRTKYLMEKTLIRLIT